MKDEERQAVSVEITAKIHQREVDMKEALDATVDRMVGACLKKIAEAIADERKRCLVCVEQERLLQTMDTPEDQAAREACQRIAERIGQ